MFIFTFIFNQIVHLHFLRHPPKIFRSKSNQQNVKQFFPMNCVRLILEMWAPAVVSVHNMPACVITMVFLTGLLYSFYFNVFIFLLRSIGCDYVRTIIEFWNIFLIFWWNREEVAWDIDTIYLSHDTRILNLRDFDHLESK